VGGSSAYPQWDVVTFGGDYGDYAALGWLTAVARVADQGGRPSVLLARTSLQRGTARAVVYLVDSAPWSCRAALDWEPRAGRTDGRFSGCPWTAAVTVFPPCKQLVLEGDEARWLQPEARPESPSFSLVRRLKEHVARRVVHLVNSAPWSRYTALKSNALASVFGGCGGTAPSVVVAPVSVSWPTRSGQRCTCGQCTVVSPCRPGFGQRAGSPTTVL
jgi:hypothetical protein